NKLIESSEEEAKQKEQQKLHLEENVSSMIKQITSVNERLQQNIFAQNELTHVVNEIASGSTGQTNQVITISEQANSSLEQMKTMMRDLQLLKTDFDHSKGITTRGNELAMELENNM